MYQTSQYVTSTHYLITVIGVSYTTQQYMLCTNYIKLYTQVLKEKNSTQLYLGSLLSSNPSISPHTLFIHVDLQWKLLTIAIIAALDRTD